MVKTEQIQIEQVPIGDLRPDPAITDRRAKSSWNRGSRSYYLQLFESETKCAGIRYSSQVSAK